jgi:6-phosphofructokinase 1
LNGESDKMVTLVRHSEPVYHCTTGLAELVQVANVQKLMPASYLDESRTMVTKPFYDYALPLIGGPLSQHTRLQKIGVRR